MFSSECNSSYVPTASLRDKIEAALVASDEEVYCWRIPDGTL